MIFHNSPLGVAVLLGTESGQLDGSQLLYANPALIKLLEQFSEDGDFLEAIKELVKIPSEGQSTGLLPLPQSADEIAQSVIKIEQVPGKKKGSRWFELRAQPTEIIGERAHFIWVNDITQSKRREIAAEEKAAQADAAAEAKSAFLAMMSHELRTPMQSVFGMLELMRDFDLPQDLETMIATAQNSASGMLEILDDILDLAKVDADKMELDQLEVPLRTLVFGMTEALQIKARQKNITLKADVDQGVPPVIIADPKRLRQILINLTGNAIKFTERGSVTICVSQDIQEIDKPEKGIALRFEIKDTGIGMTDKVAAKLFQPFTQADNTTARRFGGTGLGLSISQRLVDLMGGEIGVRSDVGKGSTFWFEIPTIAVEDFKDDTKLPDLKGLSVLSVEDHPQGAKEIKRSLEHMGAKVSSVETYEKGLELIEHQPFDVAVIDHGLPDGEGFELLKHIHQIRPGTGLILYTVYDDFTLQQGCNFIGATHLLKPASRIGLGEAVKKAARQQRAEHSIQGPRRLLICEDTDSVIEVLKRQIQRFDVEVDFVKDGREALKALEENEYGMLISDLHMPEMDGYDLIKVIRDEENGSEEHMPVIVMTADVQMAHENAYMTHGFDECLLKPVSLGQFERLLIRWGFIDKTFKVDKKVSMDSGKKATVQSDGGVPAIDVEMIKRQIGAVDESALEMIDMFIDMTKPLLEKLRNAFNDEDRKEIRNHAHSIKGASRSAGCPALGDVAETIQDMAEKDGELDQSLMDQAEDEFKRIPATLKKLKGE